MNTLEIPVFADSLQSSAEVEKYIKKLAGTIIEIVGGRQTIYVEAYRHKSSDYIGMYTKGELNDYPVIFTIADRNLFPEPERPGIDIWVTNVADAIYVVRSIAKAIRGDTQLTLI